MTAFTLIATLGKLMIFVGLCMAVFFGSMHATERLIEKLAKSMPAALKGVAMGVGAILSLGLFLYAFGSFYEF